MELCFHVQNISNFTTKLEIHITNNLTNTTWGKKDDYLKPALSMKQFLNAPGGFKTKFSNKGNKTDSTNLTVWCVISNGF